MKSNLDQSQQPSSPEGFDKSKLVGTLRQLSVRLKESGIKAEICLIGGAAMTLAFNSRESTRDVNAVLPRETAQAILREAQIMADEDLPADWLNDSARVFMPKGGDMPKKSPVLQFENLTVYAPPAEYMLAMKVLASRLTTDKNAGDVGDIRFLLDELKISTPEEALNIVSMYYDPERIAPQAKYLLQDLCKDINRQKNHESPQITT